MSPKVNPIEYSAPLPAGMSIEQIKTISEKNLGIFAVQFKSEIMKGGIVAVKGEGKYENQKIKYEWYAKIEGNQIKMKLISNFEIKKILDLPEPRDSPKDQTDCAWYLYFWDSLLQDLGTEGRKDIGKPRKWNQATPAETISSPAVAQVPAQPTSAPLTPPPMMHLDQAPLSPPPMSPPPATTAPRFENVSDDNVWATPSPSATPAPTSMPSLELPKPSLTSTQSVLNRAKAIQQETPSHKPTMAEQIDYDAIPEEISPFLLDNINHSPYYYKFKKTLVVTAEEVVQQFRVNLTMKGFAPASLPKVPPPLVIYRGKGKFGPDKMLIDIIVGEKDGFIYIRFIGDGLRLDGIYDKDIKIASPDRNQAAFFIKMFDEVVNELNLPPRDDWGKGGSELSIQADSITLKKLNDIQKTVIGMVMDKIQKNGWIKIHMTHLDTDTKQNLEDFKLIRSVFEKNVRWSLNNLAAYKMIMRNFVSPFIIVFVDIVDIKSKTVFPILVTYTIVPPNPVAREVICSYKSVWTTRNIDDVGQKITSRLNVESPGLERQLKEFFNEYSVFLYQDEELIDDRGRKIKLAIEHTLHEPLLLKNYEDEEGHTKSVITLSQFLLPDHKKFANLREPNIPCQIFETSIDVLSRFYVLPESEQKKEDEGLKGFNKCPKCGWTLSGQKTKCPMCKYDAALAGDASSTKKFSASAALIGAKADAKTDQLIGSLDSLIGDIDEEMRQIQAKVVKIFREVMINDKDSQPIVEKIEGNNEDIKKSYGVLLRSLTQDLKFPLIPFQFLEIHTKEIAFDRIIVAMSMIKEDYSNYYATIISYFLPVSSLPAILTLKREIIKEDEELGKKISGFNWYAKGDDLGLIKTFNNPEFMAFVKEVFGGEQQKYASHFQAKKRDLIGRVVEVQGMEYELPFLMAVRPFVEGGIPGNDVLVLHHFLKSEAENFAGIIPFSKTLILIDAIAATIQSTKKKLEQPEETPAPPPPQKTEIQEEMDKVFGEEQPTADVTSNQPQDNTMETNPNDTIPSPPPQMNTETMDMRQQIVARCLELELNPNMSLEEIDQKAQEIAFQRQSMEEMLNQLNQAYAAAQITQEQYQVQLQQLNQYLKTFEDQVEVLIALRSTKTM